MSNAHAVHSLGSLDTDIVIDIGCLGWQRANGVEDSISVLLKRFSPKVLFGFDPHPALKEAVGNVNGAIVMTSRRAAWTFDGNLGLELAGNCTHVGEGLQDSASVFDIAAWVRSLPVAKIVLKIDAEGAEYVILPHLIEQGLIARFSRILVEWHDGRYANGYEQDRQAILDAIPFAVEEWK